MATLVNLSSPTISATTGSSVAVATGIDLANGIGNLTAATVRIATGFDAAQDQLGISGQVGTSGTVGTLAWSYDDATGTLTFTGSASEAVYEAALQQVVYTNTSGTGAKSVQIGVSKIGLDTASGAYYEYYADEGITWQAAQTEAAGKSFLGTTGFLATITSAAEQAFVNGILAGNAWIGGTEAGSDNIWTWRGGPENNSPFWQGDSGGSGSSYTNWLGGEPNNGGPTGEGYVIVGGISNPVGVGTWYDEPETGGGGAFGVQGYLVDYGSGFVSTSALTLNISTGVVPPPPAPLAPITRNEIFNFKQFAAAGKFSGAATAYTPFVVDGLSTDLFFDEVRYLRNNQDVAAAVQGGQYANGYAHFSQFGWLEGRDFTSVYNESYYLSNNADVAQAVANGGFRSGFEHFTRHGQKEWRDSSALFSKQDYLTRYDDVRQAVDTGAIGSVFEHWIELGANEMRTPQLTLFQENFYLERYADVKAGVQSGTFADGFAHYLAFGAREGRDPSAIFSESAYLELNADVKSVVQSGALPSGLAHYVLFGRAEERQIAAVGG
jgi:Lectin C-type domain